MKEPICLLVNDLHINKDNISDFHLNFQEAISICEKKHIRTLAIGGDVFTDRASQTLPVLYEVRDMVETAGAHISRVYIAEGNHDKPDVSSNIGYNHLWQWFSRVYVVSDASIVDFGEDVPFVLIIMSYFHPDKFLENLAKAVGYAKQRHHVDESHIILYIHQGVHGALGDFEIEDEIPQEPLLPFKAVLCGHYHNRCKIKGTNIEFIGASRQHNFGEDERKGYTILYSDGSYEFVQNTVNTRYKTIELDADDVMNGGFALDKQENCKYKLKVRCDEQQSATIDKQKLLDMGFNKIELVSTAPVSKEVAAQGISEKYDASSIKKEYQGFCDERGIDSGLGLKYLEN